MLFFDAPPTMTVAELNKNGHECVEVVERINRHVDGVEELLAVSF